MIRWLLQLSAYSYTIKHKSSNELQNVDASSLLPRSMKNCTIPEPQEVLLISGQREFPITAIEIEKTTNKLLQFKHAILHGWPYQIPEEMDYFVRRKMELSPLLGCIIQGSRTVIPKILQKELSNQLHSGHEGMTRMKMMAISFFWWPKLEEQIEFTVSSCEECQKHHNNPEPVKGSWPSPHGP
ncbi:hypothetical protein JTB14_019245 [Gonioctena quinquepunctata]|nr:hypothetical protein JTB14_019245 [Gonioctena quinquepunctata]